VLFRSHLVREHSGCVKAESAGPGKGATFTVDFPLQPSANTTEKGRRVDFFSASTQELWKDAERDAVPALHGITVLVVEDEADTRDLVTTMLREFGARVVAVNSAKDALIAIQQEVPSVLLSDIGMSGQNGYELIRAVRALAPEKGGKVPAVALTAYAAPADRRRALIAGFHVHLAKPVEPDELLAVISSLGRIAPGAE